MKNLSSVSTAFLIATAILVVSCGNNQKSNDPSVTELTQEQLIQKGEYLVTVMGCHDCHSPKQVGPQGSTLIPELLLSGYPADRPVPEISASVIKNGLYILNDDLTAAAGPWGISFAANLTSDATGIGNWTEENFKRALKEGKFKGLEGARTLLPPMPWANFANIRDEDVKALFAYLQSTTPIRNIVPAPIPPTEFNGK